MTICDFVAPEQGTEKVISDSIARRLLSDAMFFFWGGGQLFVGYRDFVALGIRKHGTVDKEDIT